MNIKKIVNEMKEFEEEMKNDFKDKETFWKHFYKKLDKEIYKEFQKIIKWEKFEEIDHKKEVSKLLKQVFKNIDDSEIEIIEVEVKEKTT